MNINPKTYAMTVVNMGDRPSATIAQIALRKTAFSSKDKYPESTEIIIRNSYMDDIPGGANSQEEADDIKSLAKDAANVSIMEMSNVSEENIMEVRNKACEILLSHRLHIKAQTGGLKKAAKMLNVFYPKKRDDKVIFPFFSHKKHKI